MLICIDVLVCALRFIQIDAGVPEKVLLLSRDEQNMMVVSYADLKACAEGAYAQVNEAEERPPGQ
jgi:hypothetical protein